MIHNFFAGDELDNWIKTQNWTLKEDGKVFICNQDAHIKSKNIAEKIDFDSKWRQYLSFTNVAFWYIFYFVRIIFPTLHVPKVTNINFLPTYLSTWTREKVIRIN